MTEVRPFKLSESFIKEYEGKQPDFGFNGLGYVVYKRTYARLKEDGTTEEFWETCKRVVEGCYNIQKKHCYSLGLEWDNKKAQRSAQEMFQRMWEMKWLPPGRGLWMMGTEYVNRTGSASMNNCGMVSSKDLNVDLAEPFCWLMDMLMLGVGVGFDTKGAGTVKIYEPKQGQDTFVVEDSREGWVSLLRRVLTAYSGRGSLPADVDYSNVRPAGEPIRGFGGTASGPDPLVELVKNVQDVLDPLTNDYITSEAIVDICNLIGRCVVAGNVRRSAELSLGDPDDETFLNLKNPDLHKEMLYHHRWASNNSVFASVGMDYSKTADLTSVNGEPGYLWLDNVRAYGRMIDSPDYKDRDAVGTNPCSEQSLENMELCNLVETFPARHNSYEDYERTLKYSYLYAKTVTLIPTHNQRTNQIVMKNRRIGTSMSGIVQAIKRHGRREFFNWCDKGYNYIRELDIKYSDWLCVRESIKVTSVKPSGSVSLLAGATPGIHFPQSQYYVRRVRLQDGHPLVAKLKEHGYPIEKDKYSPNTVVASFPIKEELFERSKSSVSMWEQLELAAQMQAYWADNQVSVTVTFNKDEAKDIKHALELYETRLKSVSFLPVQDHSYEQAPYESITPEEYEKMIKNIKSFNMEIDIEGDLIDRFCDGELCEIK